REHARGANPIGTTGRGIGPAYEDKVARRAVRFGDVLHRERFAAKLGEILDFHNFVLQHYYKTDAIDFQKTLEQYLALGEELAPLMTDVTDALDRTHSEGGSILF